LVKILSEFTVPANTSNKHLFSDPKLPFSKDAALRICENLKDRDHNVVFNVKPDEFWICSCVTHPEMSSMPNNIAISYNPVETLYCVKENEKWRAFCAGRKHAIFVRGYDKQGHEHWFFNEKFIFQIVFKC